MSRNSRLRTLAYRGEGPLQGGRGLILGLVIGLSAVGLSFLYLWQATQIRDFTARCNLLQGELSKAEEINRTLELEIEEAFSLERIGMIARERLGMVEPSVVRYVPIHRSDGE